MRNQNEITHEHIEKALQTLASVGTIPPRRASVRFDLLYKGKRYPPKYVLSRALRIVTPKGKGKGSFFRGGKRTNDFLTSRGFKVIPKHEAANRTPNADTRFWVVSPNVTFNPKTIDLWKEAINDHHVAFMGWGPDNPKHKLGSKFAKGIVPGDVILIARRSNGVPDVVGFGLVTGNYLGRLRGFTAPDTKWRDGSIRKLSPFVQVKSIPSRLPIMSALNHTASLAELHPLNRPDHRMICEWMRKRLGLSTGANGNGGRASEPRQTNAVTLSHVLDPKQLDYKMQKTVEVSAARRREAGLVMEYRDWLAKKGCSVWVANYQGLRCDAYERKRNNLVEAKSSNKREYIRMAVGQLLDFAFLGKGKFGTPNMAILLPRKPEAELLQWLDGLKIKVIWKQRRTFVDNAEGTFV